VGRAPYHAGVPAAERRHGLWRPQRAPPARPAAARSRAARRAARGRGSRWQRPPGAQVTLELLRSQRKTFRYYIFLNSSVRGPFYPSYMPAGWQWTQAYTARLSGRVKVVSSSLVCLPDIDASGGGPRVESWAFALDREGLELTVGAGVFAVRTCKLCGENGVVSGGEYGISRAVLGGNFNLATLQSMYRRDVNWSDPQHWGCNDNVHASRHGTYDGISMHPFETVFVKASWRVGEPHLTAYTRWFAEHAAGLPNTAGALNQALYRYAVSPGAQDPPPVDRCFAVPVSA